MLSRNAIIYVIGNIVRGIQSMIGYELLDRRASANDHGNEDLASLASNRIRDIDNKVHQKMDQNRRDSMKRSRKRRMDDEWLAKVAENGRPNSLRGLQKVVGPEVGHQRLTDTLNEMQDMVLREEEGKEEEEGEEDLLEAEKLLREYMTNVFDESLIERPRIE